MYLRYKAIIMLKLLMLRYLIDFFRKFSCLLKYNQIFKIFYCAHPKLFIFYTLEPLNF